MLLIIFILLKKSCHQKRINFLSKKCVNFHLIYNIIICLKIYNNTLNLEKINRHIICVCYIIYDAEIQFVFHISISFKSNRFVKR